MQYAPMVTSSWKMTLRVPLNLAGAISAVEQSCISTPCCRADAFKAMSRELSKCTTNESSD